MNPEDFVKLFYQETWFEGLTGHIGLNESILIVHSIFDRRPKLFVEIGAASGFSTAMFAKALKLIEGDRILSFDVSPVWYADRTKQVGFLARNLGSDAVPVSFVQGSSAEIPSHVSAGSVGGAFVDGSHYHPWATIDTLMLMPLMQLGGFIGHHDLNLYMYEDYRDQLGPKYLFDQLPEPIRIKDREQPFSRSFLINVPPEYRTLTKNMIESLSLPWSGDPEEITSEQRFANFVEKSWSFAVAQKLRK